MIEVRCSVKHRCVNLASDEVNCHRFVKNCGGWMMVLYLLASLDAVSYTQIKSRPSDQLRCIARPSL